MWRRIEDMAMNVWTFPWEDVSHWLGLQGYVIREVRLSSDGNDVVFTCVDAAVGDAERPVADDDG